MVSSVSLLRTHDFPAISLAVAVSEAVTKFLQDHEFKKTIQRANAIGQLDRLADGLLLGQIGSQEIRNFRGTLAGRTLLADSVGKGLLCLLQGVAHLTEGKFSAVHQDVEPAKHNPKLKRLAVLLEGTSWESVGKYRQADEALKQIEKKARNTQFSEAWYRILATVNIGEGLKSAASSDAEKLWDSAERFVELRSQAAVDQPKSYVDEMISVYKNLFRGSVDEAIAFLDDLDFEAKQQARNRFHQHLSAFSPEAISEVLAAFDQFEATVRYLSAKSYWNTYDLLTSEFERVWPTGLSAAEALREQRR